MDESISCKPRNIASVNGTLKILEWLCDLIATIISGAASVVDGKSGHRAFFLFVCIFALIITTLIIMLILLNIQKAIKREWWPGIELVWCALISLLYFIASIVIATIAKYNGAYGAAAFFGFAAFIVYVADGIYQCLKIRRDSIVSRASQYGANPTG